MARLIIIVTTFRRKECIWNHIAEWESCNISGVDSRCKQFGDDFVVVFCHPPCNGEGPLDIAEQQQRTTEMITKLASAEEVINYGEIYIAAHRRRIDWDNTGFGERLKAWEDFDLWREQGSNGQDIVYDAILGCVKNPSSESLNSLVEAIRRLPILSNTTSCTSSFPST